MGNVVVGTRAILFTDMVGSSELRSTLGDDRADALRRAHDEMLRVAVETHHGSVLRWTGDGIKAEFEASSAAVSAAIAMQRAVRAYGRRSDSVAPFEIRIGLSVGEIIVEDGDDHGVAVIEAARLEALARPGEILATDLVQRLGERRLDAIFEEAGSHSLKGLDRPVTVVRIIDVAVDTDTPPVPRALALDRRFPMVGRAAAMSQFARQWSLACSGTASTLFVSGEPGMGKSCLMAHAAERAHADGALVLVGVCDSELVVPYQPFATALRDAAASDEVLASAVETGTGALSPLFPAHRTGRPEDQGPAARYDLFAAVAALVKRLATQRPVVLVLEDLQWAAAPTLLLLRHLVLHTTDARLLILGTYRTEEVGSNHPLRDSLAEIQGTDRVDRLELTALTENDVIEMVSIRAPSASAENIAGLARRVHDESAGSPFFVCELLHHLSTTGQLERLVGEGAGDRLPIPDSVRDVVAQRLNRLPEESQEILAAAAVIGLNFELALLAATVNQPQERVLDIVEQISRVAIVHETDAGRYAFSHAIVRTTLLDGMSATRQAIAHRRIAEAVEQQHSDRHDELARHWKLAGVEPKAFANLSLAAERDLQALAYESAADRFQQVLDYLQRTPESDLEAKARAWLGLGLARRALGKLEYFGAVEEAGRLARRLHDADLMADAAIASIWPGNFFITAGRIESGLVELCEDALELLDPRDPRRVQIMCTLASHLTFDVDRGQRQALLGAAQQMARELGDPTLLGNALAAEFLAMWDPTTFVRRGDIVREISRMARASGDSALQFFGLFFAAICATERGDLTGARARLAQLDRLVVAPHEFYFRFLVERLAVSLDIFTGSRDAQAAIDDLAARYESTHADTAGTWAVQTGIVALQEGRLAEMAEPMRVMIDESHTAPSWLPAYGMALLANGRRDEAEAVLDTFVEPPMDYFWLTTMQSLADLAFALHRVDACKRIHDALLPFSDQLGVTTSGALCFGLVARHVGQLCIVTGEVDRAVALLQESVTRADAMGAPFESTTSRRLLAQAMLAAGLPADDVHDVISEAIAIATANAFAWELRELTSMQIAADVVAGLPSLRT